MAEGVIGYFTVLTGVAPVANDVCTDMADFLNCFETASEDGAFGLYQCTILNDGTITGVTPVCRVAYPLPVNVSEAEAYIITSISKGTQPKWYKDGFWVKEDFLGYEGLAEDLVSRLSECVRNIESVRYYSTIIERGHSARGVGCKSLTFLPPGYEYRPLYRLLGGHKLPEPTVDAIGYVIEEVLCQTGVDLTEYLAKNIYLDAITLNEDRHLNNLGLLYNGSYMEAPIFDNGLSCLSDMRDYGGLSISEGIKAVRSKPFNRHFEKQVSAMQSFTDFKLRIDAERAYDLLAHYTNPFYTGEQVHRACTVLHTRLSFWEGKTWEPL